MSTSEDLLGSLAIRLVLLLVTRNDVVDAQQQDGGLQNVTQTRQWGRRSSLSTGEHHADRSYLNRRLVGLSFDGQRLPDSQSWHVGQTAALPVDAPAHISFLCVLRLNQKYNFFKIF